MITLLSVADDCTGALETCVQLAGCGAPTRVVTDPGFAPANGAGAGVVVMDAETRTLPPVEAGAVVGGRVRRAVERKVPYIEKKTGSALRGNVGAELGALLAASGERRCLSCRRIPRSTAAPGAASITSRAARWPRAFLASTPLSRCGTPTSPA